MEGQTIDSCARRTECLTHRYGEHQSCISFLKPPNVALERSDILIPEEVAVQRFDAGGSEIAVFEFQGELRELIISGLRNGYLATGDFVSGGKALSSQGVMSMAVAGAASAGTLLSASLSSSLFMATANPATLMTLGSGVGSAVMGVNGIVAQAPFIAVAAPCRW